MEKYFSEKDTINDVDSMENRYVYVAPKRGVVTDFDESYDVSEDLELWISSITEYVLRNIYVCRKYMDIKQIVECRLVCEYEGRNMMDVKALSEGSVISLLAEEVPEWDVSEDDRDEYREAKALNEIIWLEFCQCVKEENRKSVMDTVCRRVTETLGCSVNWELKK